VRDSPAEGASFDPYIARSQCLTNDDIRNIGAAMVSTTAGITDSVSVQDMAAASEDVFYYKGSADEIIAVGVQTKSQRQLMKRFGLRFLGIDTTHKVTVYEHKLVVLVTMDQHGRGLRTWK